MTLRQYLVLMTVGTLLAWSAVGVIVLAVDPAEAQTVIFAILYASLFMALTGTLSVSIFLIRTKLLRRSEILSRQVSLAFRQAMMLSALAVLTLHLQGKGLLTWWNSILMILALTLLEFFFISTKVKKV